MSKEPDHWQQFYDFCRYDKLAGGPDPHMACIGEICRSRHLSPLDTAWLGALYASVYNVPTALILWERFPCPDEALHEDEVEAWLARNWKGIAFRRERKAVRSTIKLAMCLTSAAKWVKYLPVYLEGWQAQDLVARYERAFEDVQRIYGFGRYIGQKYLEFGRRYCGWNVRVPDIRAKDGWSPRAGLALLLPNHQQLLVDGGDSPQAVRVVEDLAAAARIELDIMWGLKLDFYELQVLLCDYKQSYVGGRQYPGRSVDSELEYAWKLRGYWGANFDAAQETMLRARLAIHPRWALGEQMGWDEVRKPLGKVLRDHGYTWTDSLYDWHTSKNDLTQPHLF